MGCIVNNGQNAAFLSNFNIDQQLKSTPNHLHYIIKFFKAFRLAKKIRRALKAGPP
jgi:hypothetical protein